MSELQAAMGLAVLNHIDCLKKRREEAYQVYLKLFKNIPKVQLLKIRADTEYNFAYFPVIFPDEEQALEIKKSLEKKDIFPRRYFYPSLNRMVYVDGSRCEIGESISERILCLPLYDSILEAEQTEIVEIIKDIMNGLPSAIFYIVQSKKWFVLTSDNLR